LQGGNQNRPCRAHAIRVEPQAMGDVVEDRPIIGIQRIAAVREVQAKLRWQ
jgi:hypothetical protein